MSPALEELIRALARAAVDDHLAGLSAPLDLTPSDTKDSPNEEAQAHAAQTSQQ